MCSSECDCCGGARGAVVEWRDVGGWRSTWFLGAGVVPPAAESLGWGSGTGGGVWAAGGGGVSAGAAAALAVGDDVGVGGVARGGLGGVHPLAPFPLPAKAR